MNGNGSGRVEKHQTRKVHPCNYILAVTQDLGRKGLTDAGSRFVSSPLDQRRAELRVSSRTGPYSIRVFLLSQRESSKGHRRRRAAGEKDTTHKHINLDGGNARIIHEQEKNLLQRRKSKATIARQNRERAETR